MGYQVRTCFQKKTLFDFETIHSPSCLSVPFPKPKAKPSSRIRFGMTAVETPQTDPFPSLFECQVFKFGLSSVERLSKRYPQGETPLLVQEPFKI